MFFGMRSRIFRPGLLPGLAAFISWGLVPLYWRQIREVPAFEILAHRAIWSLVFVGLLLTLYGQWREVVQTPQALAITALRGLLVSANWLIFIWAVNAGHIVDTSMGYFINPLVSLVIGVFLFHEKLSHRQWSAVAAAVVGVLIAALETNRGFPWVAVGLALTFGCYGALKKIARIGPMPGLFLETAFMVPIALVYLWKTPHPVKLNPLLSHTSLFLIGGGIITAFPLLWFAQAAQRLRLSTVSFIQFVAPTLTFLIGVFIYHEAFSTTRLLAFICIWVGVLIFTFDAWRRSRETMHSLPEPVAIE